MAKFKVGDKVKATESSRRGQVGKIIYVGDIDPNDVKYEVEFDKKENGMKRLGFYENELVKVYNSYLKAVVTNGIGDCFSDAAYSCEKALRGNADTNLKAALHDVEYVTSYSYADAKDKAGKAKCVAAIKAAISNPTKDNIAKAKKACDEERKRADGIMPTFNNLATSNAVVANRREFDKNGNLLIQGEWATMDNGTRVQIGLPTGGGLVGCKAKDGHVYMCDPKKLTADKRESDYVTFATRNSVVANADTKKLNDIKKLFGNGFYRSTAKISGNKVIVEGGDPDWCFDVLWENGFVKEARSLRSDGERHTITVNSAKNIVANALAWCGKAVCNAGKAQISKYGNDWYYVWADGSKNGKEGPFKTSEQATIAAKTDGFRVVNAEPVAKNAIPDAGNITGKQIDDHANSFVRNELTRVAKMLRQEWDKIYSKWCATSICQGYIRAGGKKSDAESAIDDYMNRLSSAWNNLERL